MVTVVNSSANLQTLAVETASPVGDMQRVGNSLGKIQDSFSMPDKQLVNWYMKMLTKRRSSQAPNRCPNLCPMGPRPPSLGAPGALGALGARA